MIEITIPAVGVAMTEATVLEWLKQPGDLVEAGEGVVEIETDKATTELDSTVAGRLGAHLVPEGETVPVGTVVVRVLEGDEREGDATVAAAPAAVVEAEPAATAPVAKEQPPHRLSPRERRLAAEQAAAQPEPADRFRELIAAKTLEAWQTIPHFALTRELDAEPLLAAHAAARAEHGRQITLTDLLLRALARTLPAGRPADVALAVATPRGVLNPVIPDVLAHTLPALAELRAAAVQRARDGRLNTTDVAPATTTLSNLGTAGVDQFTGVITPGQQTLLTLGTIAPRAVVEGDAVVVRRTLHATLNADHRTLDGADAAALLDAFAAALSDGAARTEAGA
ncbi:MAG TPA: 2-oxo acid dehydrogenase subunit E2 [Conexibacter sp.]|nr:2-oxo acid dehydrogenase subunit E2 [Conexibacter sp.]